MCGRAVGIEQYYIYLSQQPTKLKGRGSEIVR
jgi:hypothetical protein